MKMEKTSNKSNFFIANILWKKVLFIILSLLSGLLLISEGAKVYSLACTRTAQAPNTCKISNFTLSGTEVKQFPLNQLKEARLDKSKSSKSRIVTVILITENEVIKFGSISSVHANKKQQIVSEVNTFLQNPKQLTVSVQEPPSFSLIFYGIIVSSIAFLIVFCKAKE